MRLDFLGSIQDLKSDFKNFWSDQSESSGLSLWRNADQALILLLFGVVLLLASLFHVPQIDSNPKQDILWESSEQTLPQTLDLWDLILSDPAQFDKLLSKEIVSLMGKPVWQRRDLNAMVWQYQSADCVLNIYFQVPIDGDISALNPKHWTLRPRTGENTVFENSLRQAACLKTLVKI
jgi:hypothetical protein